MSLSIVISSQFRGPPNSGNGGYVCGLLAGRFKGAATAVLRAPVPLNSPLLLVESDGAVSLTTKDGARIGEARPVDTALLPDVPKCPDLERVAAASLRFPGLKRRFHPVCFTCGDQLEEGIGLRVFTGQVEGAAVGLVAGPWSVHQEFVDAKGLAPPEIVWAALDCPGSVAWVACGGGAGLLGTMTAQIHRYPRLGELNTVLAWPIEQSGRKQISGTALYHSDGELLARSRQVWIKLDI